MPIILNKKNVRKSLFYLFQENEEIIAVLITKGVNPSALVLTSQKRVLIATIPLIGRSEIKEEYHIDEIESVDFFPGSRSITLIIRMIEKSGVFTLPAFGSRFPLKSELNKFITEIRTMNPRAKPEYLEKNENIIEILKVKQGIFKFTESNIFLFKSSGEKGEKWEINEKIPFNSIEEFDYYPETPEILYLYIENNRGESRLFKIESNALFFNDHLKYGNPDLVIENIYEAVEPHRKRPAPSYLYDDEVVVTTCKASINVSGTTAQDVILRFTNKRFIELSREKQGRLDVKVEINLGEIEDTSIVKQTGIREGQGSDKYYVLTITIAEEKKYEYWIEESYQYALNKLFVHLET